MTNRVSGNSRGNSYIGTNAPQPPNMNFVPRSPTEFDREGVQVGDFWINTATKEIWYLGSLANDGITTIKGKQAHWINLTGGGGGGSIQLHPDAGSPDVTPEANIINVFGGPNINTSGPGAAPQNTLSVNLNTSIFQPATNADGSEGLYALGGHDFMHAYGDGSNTFLGIDAGNRTLTTNNATANTGIGYTALQQLTTGANNTAIGNEAGGNITTGSDNTFVGFQSGGSLTTGSQNIAIGSGALLNADTPLNNIAIGQDALSALNTGDSNIAIGKFVMQSGDTISGNIGIGDLALADLTTGLLNTGMGAGTLGHITTGEQNLALGADAGFGLDTSDSSNILLAHLGVSGDNNTIRIGTQGAGIGEQDLVYVAGISGVTINNPTPNTVVNVGTDGQLGQLELTSSGATVEITQPSAGVINLEAIGGGGGGNPFSFSYVQVASTGALVDNTTYSLGQDVVLTKLFDVGGVVYPGDGLGAPATFTAPVTGKYYLEYYVYHTSLTIFPIISIVTTTRTYQKTAQKVTANDSYCVVTDMDMGDMATFTILGNNAGSWTVTGNGINNNLNSTRISGFLIPEGATGGNFSQPFLGIQQVDAVNVTGGGVVYSLGSAAPMVEQYDVGSNFDPGDGIGGAATFTAPETGIYSFTVSVSGAPGVLNVGINSPSLNYLNYSNNATPALTFTTSLTAADVVTFIVEGQPGLGANSVSVFAINPGSTLHPPSVNGSFVSGYRIA